MTEEITALSDVRKASLDAAKSHGRVDSRFNESAGVSAMLPGLSRHSVDPFVRQREVEVIERTQNILEMARYRRRADERKLEMLRRQE